jgi:glutamyl-tRNA reductase
MTLIVFGISHKTAPLALREQVAIGSDMLPLALNTLRALPGIHEVAILSTCNRTELYCHAEHAEHSHITGWLSSLRAVAQDQLSPHLNVYRDRDAILHMLRVASGLDSMMLGEPQILGQMKSAYQDARQLGALSGLLGRLFQHIFTVAKQVRTETALGRNPVSIAFAAVRLAQQILGNLTQSRALLVGAGDTAALVGRHLREQGVATLVVANRNLERGQALAEQLGGTACALSDIPQALINADIVACATASPLPLIGKGMVERALKARKHRLMFMADLAVPRDIENEVGELNDVYLYTVDDLEQVVEENRETRREAAQEAEHIIQAQADRFIAWMQEQEATDTIRRLHETYRAASDDVLQKAKRLLHNGKPPEEALTFLAHTLANRLGHAPSVALRRAAQQGRLDVIENAIELFNLADGNSRREPLDSD